LDYSFQPLAFLLFAIIVGVTLAISFWAAKRMKTSSHYYVAGGGIKWLMNGIAF
jgi:cation/acetate symporter